MSGEQMELALDAKADLGEGPVWDDQTGRLIWVDIMANRVNLFEPSTKAVRSIDVGAPVGAVAMRASDGLLIALADGLALLSLESEELNRLCELPGVTPAVRMNDGKCDVAGRFWIGTMAYNFQQGAGSLYRLEAGRPPVVILQDLTISNGIDWSPDASRMYFVDSPTRGIDVFDYDPSSGGISGRRTFAEITLEGAVPDGLCVDAEGNVWVALWGGSCVQCFDPNGRLQTTVPVPASQVTSCAFGGADLSDLYITTARGGLSAAQLDSQPQAGGLFRIRPGVKGRVANRFAG
ncbi:MAG: SMP-30/gluconolactonase/LRE family protein [Acidobacteria bacterium]|nr:SMP-30/gluconolactonase/LRE family protein [Acidobacteriota bacterium]